MSEKEMLSEELLDGWLSMSMAIWNERLVSAMTYNESMVLQSAVQAEKDRGRAADGYGPLRKAADHKAADERHPEPSGGFRYH